MLFLKVMKLGIERRRTMLRRTPTAVLFTVVATLVFLFGATRSYPCTCTGTIPTCGTCTPDRIARGECFITPDGKFTVEIIPDENGNFPWVNLDTSVPPNVVSTDFKYRICQLLPPTQNLSHINIQVGEPCAIKPYPPGCTTTCQSTPSGSWITSETGESSTRFGSYDADFDVYKWGNLSNFCYGEISLTMSGKVSAYPNQMLLKYGSSNFPVGKILGPSCFVPDKVANLEEVITYETLADDIRCLFDQRGNLIDCIYGYGTSYEEVLKKYPVGNVKCQLTGDTGTSSLMTLEFISDKSKIATHHSPGAVWYTYRGRLLCKEVPKDSGGCP
jgi:hypothetical protein